MDGVRHSVGGKAAMAGRRISMAEEWQTWAKRYDIDGGIRTFESGLTLHLTCEDFQAFREDMNSPSWTRRIFGGE